MKKKNLTYNIMSNLKLTPQSISSESGITVKDSERILESFKEIAERLLSADESMGDFRSTDQITKEYCKSAREQRMIFKNIRTDGDKIHKAVKADALSRSQAIDFVRNTFRDFSKEREEKLLGIEKHFELIETKRIAKLNEDRIELLSVYNVENADKLNLGDMDDSVFDGFLQSQKLKHEAKIEDDRLAEVERVRKENEDREARVKAEKEAAKLKAEALKEAAKNKKIQDELDARLAKESAEREAKQKIVDAENKKVQDELNAKLKLEKEKSDIAMKLLNDKQENETKALLARLKKEKEDAEKLNNAKLKEFLAVNGCTKEGMESGEFVLKASETGYILYKQVANFSHGS